MPDDLFPPEPDQRWDSDNPLRAVRRWETLKSNKALHDYYFMGDARSLPKLAETYKKRTEGGPTKQLSTIKEWSTRYQWQARLEAQAIIDARKEAKKWEARRDKIKEREFEQAEKLFKLADHILAQAPNFIRQRRQVIQGKDGAPDTILITMAIDISGLAKVSKLGSDLARRAAEMEGDTTKVTGEIVSVPITMEEWKRRQAATRAQVGEIVDTFEGIEDE